MARISSAAAQTCTTVCQPIAAMTRGASRAVTAAPTLLVPKIPRAALRSEEHTSELQSLMRISYAVFCLKQIKHNRQNYYIITHTRPNTKNTNLYHTQNATQ